ncbi:hypothetical protein ACFS2C_15800 [Prauserella oleivorans]|uniref:Uncharacterized protein n=1 Tax=Prauserella oleivorans TaxID=1478153 RepID=A0ABW5WC77_9PSEU
MTKGAGEILVGDRVTYFTSSPSSGGLCRHGKVVAPPIADPYTAILWVPTRPDGAADDTEPTWVRHDRVVDIIPARERRG